ncbi:unnamed protein product, partial [Notodromas monacha]
MQRTERLCPCDELHIMITFNLEMTAYSAYKEGAILVVVLAITCFVFIGILRTRETGVFSNSERTKAEARREVEKIEKQIQQRLEAMGKKVAASKEQRRGFVHFDPNAKTPLTEQEMQELRGDLHDILENPNLGDDDGSEGDVLEKISPEAHQCDHQVEPRYRSQDFRTAISVLEQRSNQEFHFLGGKSPRQGPPSRVPPRFNFRQMSVQDEHEFFQSVQTGHNIVHIVYCPLSRGEQC